MWGSDRTLLVVIGLCLMRRGHYLTVLFVEDILEARILCQWNFFRELKIIQNLWRTDLSVHKERKAELLCLVMHTPPTYQWQRWHWIQSFVKQNVVVELKRLNEAKHLNTVTNVTCCDLLFTPANVTSYIGAASWAKACHQKSFQALTGQSFIACRSGKSGNMAITGVLWSGKPSIVKRSQEQHFQPTVTTQ